MLEEVSARVEEVRPGRQLFVRRMRLTPRPRNSYTIEYSTDPIALCRKRSGMSRNTTSAFTTAKNNTPNNYQQNSSPCSLNPSKSFLGGGAAANSPPTSPREVLRKLPLQLVFVHGLCATQEWFDSLIQSLSERLDGLEILTPPETTAEGGDDDEEEVVVVRTVVEIRCLLFDMVGCGQSPRIGRRRAYDKSELMEDLRQLMEKYLPPSDEDDGVPPTIFVGHSYGPSIVIEMLADSVRDTQRKKKKENVPEEEETTSTDKSQAGSMKHPQDDESDDAENKGKGGNQLQELPRPASFYQDSCHDDLVHRFNVQGMVFLSSAVRTESLPYPDGGKWAIRRTPVGVLRCMNGKLTSTFVEAAVHESHPEVRQIVKWQCQENDLKSARAHHASTRWATVEELKAVLGRGSCNQRKGDDKNNRVLIGSANGRIPVLIVHGIHDHIIPLRAGQELAHEIQYTTSMRFVTLESSSHMGILEEPDECGQAVMDFIQHKVVPSALEAMASEAAAVAAAAAAEAAANKVKGPAGGGDVEKVGSGGSKQSSGHKSPPVGCCPLASVAC